MKFYGLGSVLGFCGVGLLLMAVSANAACVKRHPLLGVDVSVDDASCPPATAPAAKAAAVRAAKPAVKSVAKPAAPAATVLKGDPEVRQLQQLLARAGFKPGSASGVMNERTKNAAYDFKKKYGLKAGTDNEETIEALQDVLAGRRTQPAARAAVAVPAVATVAALPVVADSAPAAGVTGDPEIHQLQTLLAATGYDIGPATGRMNDKTRDAAYAFKRAVGLKAGTDTEETLEVLRRIAGR